MPSLTENTGPARPPTPMPGLLVAVAALALLLAGCASGPGAGLGGDGVEARPPSGLDRIASVEPREEAIRQSGGTSKPYAVLGRSYTPITDDRAFRERGLASWYGRKFHGQSTASGEPYDMYAMTAAHKTLPLPSYVRVRNPANGREVVLRVNDRGPFHDDRIIDLSYTAALQLDLLRGVALVEFECLPNADIRTGAWRQRGDTLAPAAPLLLAQADIPGDAAAGASGAPGTPGAVMSDTAPPPRFGNMQTNDLPPLTPAPPAASAAPSAPSAPSAPPAPAASPAPRGAASAPPPLPAAVPSASGGAAQPAPAAAGIWVQLGAFREASGAQALQARTARSLPAVAAQLRVFSDGDTHRLQAGPYPSREVAQDVGLQLRNGLGLAPIVIERR